MYYDTTSVSHPSPTAPSRTPELVRVVKENRVESGFAGGALGGRRSGRNSGRNPKNILTAIAGESSLGIPDAFTDLVSGADGRCGRGGEGGRGVVVFWMPHLLSH